MSGSFDAADDRDFRGVEEWRRRLGLSKAGFYGPDGPAKAVKAIRVSSRRLVVSREERERFYTARTRNPEREM